MSIIEGIPDSKITRLKKHLLKVEKMTGGKLRQKKRGFSPQCPIYNFAPDTDGNKRSFVGAGISIHYGSWVNKNEVTYNNDLKLYSEGDEYWWKRLTAKDKEAITRYIQQWIKDGKEL
ncbi:MAG: hypothetical protein MUP81_02875 [Dehalococcoidia bacterium]|nr:hypothetical protein [Dehalococcoidia bacterium]